MYITGATIKESGVLDCGQEVKPGDQALIFEFAIRNHAGAAYSMKKLIEEGLATLAQYPLPLSPEEAVDTQ